MLPLNTPRNKLLRDHNKLSVNDEIQNHCKEYKVIDCAHQLQNFLLFRSPYVYYENLPKHFKIHPPLTQTYNTKLPYLTLTFTTHPTPHPYLT